MALAVAVIALVLLFLAFGSVLLPLNAVIVNIASISASFGVLVWGFQDGHLARILGFTSTGSLESADLLLVFAVLFGLTTDDEMFLLSRVRELWDETGDNRASVAVGLPGNEHRRGAAAIFLHTPSLLYHYVVSVTYTRPMPRLWNETIEAHRREVGAAILDAAAALAVKHGLLSVTMSQIAEETGIGRATLYKYFPDVESILAAWHERQVSSHLVQLAAIRDEAADVHSQLAGVLEAYALIHYQLRLAHHTDLAAHLHRVDEVIHAQAQLRALVRDLLSAAADVGAVRGDVSPDELAHYCLHALSAAGSQSSEDAVRRLVQVTLAGLRPPVASAVAE